MTLDMAVFPIERSPGKIVSRTHLLMKLGLSRVFLVHDFNITPEHWAILSVLWEKDGLNQAALAERAFKDRPNTTRILDVLERNGFVRREPDPEDRRSWRIYLTKEGKEAKAELTPLVVDFLQKAFSGLTQNEFNEFLRMNRLISNNLSDI